MTFFFNKNQTCAISRLVRSLPLRPLLPAVAAASLRRQQQPPHPGQQLQRQLLLGRGLLRLQGRHRRQRHQRPGGCHGQEEAGWVGEKGKFSVVMNWCRHFLALLDILPDNNEVLPSYCLDIDCYMPKVFWVLLCTWSPILALRSRTLTFHWHRDTSYWVAFQSIFHVCFVKQFRLSRIGRGWVVTLSVVCPNGHDLIKDKVLRVGRWPGL